MKWLWRGLLAIVALLVIAFLVFRTPDTDPAGMRAKYGAPPSQFLANGDGVKVHLRDEGPKDAPVIMLLHGSNADLHTWEPWVQALKGQYRVIRFDQVGHGLTGPDPEGDYSRANFAQDILEVADKLGLDRFVLAGNSMGGKHALAFAIAHPERLTGLVLVDASGGPMLKLGDAEDDDSGNIGFTIAQTPGINLLVEQITPRSLIRQSLEQSVSNKAVVTEAAVDRYWELLRYPGNRRATLARFSLPYDPLSEAEIASVTTPTLILWGEEDRLIPVEAGRWLGRTLPNNRLVIYPAIGHLPHEEAPAATLGDLQAWLAEHAPTAKPE
ncbi:alpha/beta fold hydrolase [Erythrobacter donghaensis]|uniref:alpha/beta fold hydrolase n=1 Tax=Erythrobacter donghaensis TaxID=267135 RepID=UPI000A3B8648|nr:alpha/beta hydrolase [Erythrobacter donghaensis]